MRPTNRRLYDVGSIDAPAEAGKRHLFFCGCTHGGGNGGYVTASASNCCCTSATYEVGSGIVQCHVVLFRLSGVAPARAFHDLLKQKQLGFSVRVDHAMFT